MIRTHDEIRADRTPLAIAPVIETAPADGLSASVAGRDGQMHTHVGVEESDGATGLSGGCDCGHEGLDAMFHMRPCPIAEARFARRGTA